MHLQLIEWLSLRMQFESVFRSLWYMLLISKPVSEVANQYLRDIDLLRQMAARIKIRQHSVQRIPTTQCRSRKRCKIETSLLHITNRKWYMAYRIVTVPLTLSDLQGQAPIAGLLKGDFSYSEIARRAVPLRSWASFLEWVILCSCPSCCWRLFCINYCVK